MTEHGDLEAYLFLLPNKLLISLFDTKNLKNYYIDEIYLENKINSLDENILNKFLDKNIFKIEKLIGKFIKNIFLVIENDQIFNLNIGIKKKNYDNINKELKAFSNELNQKEQWVVISKIDKLPEDKIQSIKKEAKKLFNKRNVFYVSSISGAGLEDIIQSIGNRLASEKN